jgi:hypothetical protein
VAVALAVCAQATWVNARRATAPGISKSALEPGAVYELNMRVSWADVEEYLSLYAKWFLPVDMAPGSGRKLLTVLSREIGDDHNLVFLYWYESPYKEQYYCSFARAFFTYHLKNEDTKASLRTLYDDASRMLGEPHRGDSEVLAQLQACRGNEVPPAAAEAMRKVDEQFRRLLVSDEDSWNIGVNPCRVQKIRAAEKNRSTVTPAELENCQKSLLEQTVRSLPGSGQKQPDESR